jgi:diguanylate cyclase (GGDEF)-like protein
MTGSRLYIFLRRQIPVLILLSLFPGLGYLFLGWVHGIFAPALVWYLLVIAESAWGYRLYCSFDPRTMSDGRRERWYRQLSWFFYSFFLLWAAIFVVYTAVGTRELNYIAIFTEIGASVVAATLLISDRRLFRPTILILMVPLIIYFFLSGEWYGYVLTVFAGILAWVLLYGARSSHQLLMQSEHQASHDALTGMYNRQYIIEHLQKLMNSLRETRTFSYLLLIDLDHFKIVNDSLGHDVGDRLLEEVAQRILAEIPKGDVVARLGGDEFIITGAVFRDREDCAQRALKLAGRLIARLKEIYVVDRHHLYISASIGVSIISDRSTNANTFIKEADIAMYEVKSKGRDGIYMFNEEMADRVERQLEIERLLHFAVPNDEISLNFQPQFDRDGSVVGAEALVRWNNPKLGAVAPSVFIPIAEQTGIIIELGDRILESAFETLRDWCASGIELQQFSINISMRQFTHHSFVARVEALAERYLNDAARRRVVLEVTESIVAEDINRVVAVMGRLKELGFRFSMDDFGTGYSSLSYLNTLPIDELKIDRAFVAALTENEGDRAMVTTILSMANIFRLKVVAEGVETAEQRDFLLRHACHLFQGHHFSRAMPKEAFVAFFRSQGGPGPGS